MKRLYVDMSRKYGAWTPIREFWEFKSGKNRRYVLCRCDCGTERVMYPCDLIKGRDSACHKCKVKVHVELGRKYGSWTAIEEVADIRKGIKLRYVRCRCDCGKEKLVKIHTLVSGSTTKCITCNVLNSSVTHGATRNRQCTTEYKIWRRMKDRCNCPTDSRYADYGGRGIKVCDRWNESFEAFLEDMGHRPSTKHTLDRIKNHLGYSPQNCKWSTYAEQNRNKRDNRLLTCNGETKCLTDWANELGVWTTSITRRLAKGWTEQKALSTPFRRR